MSDDEANQPPIPIGSTVFVDFRPGVYGAQLGEVVLRTPRPPYHYRVRLNTFHGRAQWICANDPVVIRRVEIEREPIPDEGFPYAGVVCRRDQPQIWGTIVEKLSGGRARIIWWDPFRPNTICRPGDCLKLNFVHQYD